MLKIEEIINPEEKAILAVFNPGKIEKTKKEIALFNKKTLSFLESVQEIKNNFNFKK